MTLSLLCGKVKLIFIVFMDYGDSIYPHMNICEYVCIYVNCWQSVINFIFNDPICFFEENIKGYY